LMRKPPQKTTAKRNQVIRNKFNLFLFIAFTTGLCPALAQESVALSRTGYEYLEASRRLAKLAEKAFSEADYDTAVKLADDAAYLAANAASMAAQLLEDVASSDGKSPSPAASPAALPNAAPEVLPATYTVQPWAVSKDCFWNIAGFPWVYGNPQQWRTLYNANKSKLPDPDNPDSLEPGTVLDIPSIKGELRQGAWESGKTYEAFQITGNK